MTKSKTKPVAEDSKLSQLRKSIEHELIKELNDNVGNKLTSATATGIFQIVSAAANAKIKELEAGLNEEETV